MTASGFWIGVEGMSLSVLRAAAEHERPIFCGRLSLDHTLQAELGDLNELAEWHDVALDTAIGQGYLMDLLRQRTPIGSVVLALDVSTDDRSGRWVRCAGGSGFGARATRYRGLTGRDASCRDRDAARQAARSP